MRVARSCQDLLFVDMLMSCWCLECSKATNNIQTCSRFANLPVNKAQGNMAATSPYSYPCGYWQRGESKLSKEECGTLCKPPSKQQRSTILEIVEFQSQHTQYKLLKPASAVCLMLSFDKLNSHSSRPNLLRVRRQQVLRAAVLKMQTLLKDPVESFVKPKCNMISNASQKLIWGINIKVRCGKEPSLPVEALLM